MAEPPKFKAEDIDYSLYLVTGRELLPPGKDYYQSLEESLGGGVSLVQVREKKVDTGEFYEIARRTLEITNRYNVPLIINDRLDVCLAIGAAGLHIGQTDLPISVARRLLPPGSILGVSVSNSSELSKVLDAGAEVDYIGIGAVWETLSKDVSGKTMLQPRGVGRLLDQLWEYNIKNDAKISTVAIGGVHLPNLPHLLHTSRSPLHNATLDGIALISDIVASEEPELAARRLRDKLDWFKELAVSRGWNSNDDNAQGLNDHSVFSQCTRSQRGAKDLLNRALDLIGRVKQLHPLAHQITNNVVANDSANATLALGGSPIMATHPKDVKDLSRIIDALLVNFGTITDKQGMIVAGQAANQNLVPLVFDPVAVGATEYRKQVAQELLSAWQPTVIKGNAGEIGHLLGSSEVASRGVDSVGSGFTNPGKIVRDLSRQTRAIVVMTGTADYISDGDIVLQVANGHELMGQITGSGCMLGTAITVFAGATRHEAVDSQDKSLIHSHLVQGKDFLVSTLAAVLVYTIAGQVAGARDDVKGSGTFRSAFIDELGNMTRDHVAKLAKMEIVNVD